jgi:peptidoglycan/LPS O-acetylase OafA/YrhL
MTESRSTRDNAIDLLRALAILSVLAFHSIDLHSPPEALRRVLAYGWMGVDLFFVLSGYLIARQVFSSTMTSPLSDLLRTFWMKRWMRTLPLYFVVLFAFAYVKPALLGFPFRGDILRYLTFTQNFAPLYDFIPSWSLCVEEQFYLVFPVIAFTVLRRFSIAPGLWLLPLAVSVGCRALAWRAFMSSPGVGFAAALHWPTHVHLDGISIGVFVAAAEPTWSRWAWRKYLAPAGVGLLAVVCATLGPAPGGSTTAALFLFSLISACFALVLVSVRGMALPRLPAIAVERIAVWSYGAYLWHALVSRAVDRSATYIGSWGGQVGVFVVVTFGVAALTYRFVEQPVLSLRDALLRRGSTARVVRAAEERI